MIILTQNKKSIIDCNRITIEKNIGGKKDEKFMLVGWVSAISNLTTPTLGAYPDEASAMAELEKIYSAFANGANAYQIQ